MAAAGEEAGSTSFPSTEAYRFVEETEFQTFMNQVKRRRFTGSRARTVAKLVVEDKLWWATGGKAIPESANLFYEGIYLMNFRF
jgi:hypothetical protein